MSTPPELPVRSTGKRGLVQGWADGLMVYADRRMALLFALGFSSGLPMLLVFSTLTIWLTEVGIEKSTIGVFAMVSTPYVFKFLWAPLVDQLRIPILSRLFGQRRAWILVSQVALIIGLIGMGLTDPRRAAEWTALWAVAVATASATQDVAIDAYRVQRLAPLEQGAGAAVAVFGYRMAMLVAGAGSLFIAAHFERTLGFGPLAALQSFRAADIYANASLLVWLDPGNVRGVVATLAWSQTYAVMALIAGLCIGATFLAAPLERVQVRHRSFEEAILASVVRPFLDFAGRYGKFALLILALVISFKLADALAAVMRNPFLLEAGYTKEQIAAIAQTYGMFTSIVGSLAGGVLLKWLGMRNSLWLASVMMMLSNLTFAVLAVVDTSAWALTTVISIENLTGGFGTTALVAWLSSMCNREYAATQYALLTSLSAVARTMLSAGAGAAAEQMSWASFFIGTAIAGLPALILIYGLGRVRALDPREDTP
ncbi:MAG: PAT family beta-lactamase induction signal transducer AmpG [Bradymonadia bacterium]|jgi:PAT family beta-lactamase induction signal transducer AmpG